MPMLVDRHLPDYDVSEVYTVTVTASIEDTWRAIRTTDIARDPFVRVLVNARLVPQRALAVLRRQHRPDRWAPVRFGDLVESGEEWIKLGEEREVELVAGLVGRFWQRDFGLRRMTPEEFAAFDEPGYAKTVVDLSLRPYGSTRTLLLYETRTATTDDDARAKFARYWRFVGPFAGFVMRRALFAIRAEAERTARGTPERTAHDTRGAVDVDLTLDEVERRPTP
ncbi:MAG: hypothetical protein U0V73_15615 [Acidimicrobiia bacterium]